MFGVIEIFCSIQGEGSHTGVPCVFVRLARCNLRCDYCDTPYSFGSGDEIAQEDLLERIDSYGTRYVCITGGEPMLHGDQVIALMQALVDKDMTVLLETNGTIPLHNVPNDVVRVMDIKTPGAFSLKPNDPAFLDKYLHAPNLALLNQRDEVKFVVTDRSDYEWARDFVYEHNLTDRVGHVLMAPSWDDVNPKDLVSWILEDNLDARLNLQVHKYIWGADVQGV